LLDANFDAGAVADLIKIVRYDENEILVVSALEALAHAVGLPDRFASFTVKR
jgi:hypothetical protein